MGMTVSFNHHQYDKTSMSFPGEILEKATRVLTDDERALLDQEWVGKNGTKRKLEVRCPFE